MLDKKSLQQRLIVDLSQNVKGLKEGHITWQVRNAAFSKHKTIFYGIHPTPIGQGLFAIHENTLCALSLITTTQTKSTELERLQKLWPFTHLIEDETKTQDFATSVDKTASQSLFPWLLSGSKFQLQVWRALLMIPYGKLTTYQAIANAIGNPKAVRAVGTAVGANPLSILVPCHRVIQKSGNLGGYRWGLDKKKTLISAESQ